MSHRRTQTDFDVSSLSNVDRLLLSQAVYELGCNAWQSVAKLLSKHPLLSHPRSFFTAQSCHAMYKQLRKEASLEITEEDNAAHAPLSLKLAQIHYQARFAELRSLISETEENFKKTAAEIENIRNGTQEQSQPSAEPTPNEDQSNESDMSPVSSQEKIATPEAEVATPPEPEAAPSADTTEQSQPIELTSGPSEEQEEQAETVTAKDAVPSSPSMPDAPSPQDIEIADLFEPEPDEEGDQQPSQPSKSSPSHVAEEPETEMVDVKEEINTTAPQTPAAESGAEIVNSSRASPEAPATGQVTPSEGETTTEMEVDLSQVADATSSKPEDTTQQPSVEEPSALETKPEDVPERTGTAEVEDDGATTGDEHHDEPPQKRARTNRRGRPPVTSRNAKNRRRRQSAPTSERGTEEPEEDATEEATASPAPETLKRSGKRRRSFAEGHETPKKRPRDDSEPVDEEEAGPSTTRGRRRNEASTSKRFQNVIGMLLSQISQHRNGTIFHNPIKDSEAPDYHDIVKRPMDLKTIKSKIKEGVISNSLEFQRDIYLMFANAMMYNRPGSDVYIMAEDMMADSEGFINTFRQTEGFVVGGRR